MQNCGGSSKPRLPGTVRVDISRIGPPENIRPDHDLSGFECGETALDDWLRRRALNNEASGASRTYVACLGRKVVGYYSLSTGAVAHIHAPGRIRRNVPDPVPVVILGRLAVDKTCHGTGLGSALLRDAVLRTLQAAEILGVRAILVHAISESAKRFYERCGFMESPVDPMTLRIGMKEVSRTINGSDRR